MIEEIVDLGVTLLLFTIGQNLKIKSLIRLEVWAGAFFECVINRDWVRWACYLTKKIKAGK